MQLERERQRQEKEQHAQRMYMQKMAEEAERRREAETRMGNLEREEKELISRLRKTQEMQEKVTMLCSRLKIVFRSANLTLLALFLHAST